MNSAYDPNQWHDFATGLAGATAALTGLVFVAVSIHLQAVLADGFHRRRAESTFVSLLVVLGAALLLLFPDLGRHVYGVACIVIAVPLLRRAARSASVLRLRGASREPWITWATAAFADVVLLVGGVGLLLRGLGGLYLVAVALLLMGARAMTVVWVLFVTLSEEDVREEMPTEVR
jgi:hypothetical protein